MPSKIPSVQIWNMDIQKCLIVSKLDVLKILSVITVIILPA